MATGTQHTSVVNVATDIERQSWCRSCMRVVRTSVYMTLMRGFCRCVVGSTALRCVSPPMISEIFLTPPLTIVIAVHLVQVSHVYLHRVTTAIDIHILFNCEQRPLPSPLSRAFNGVKHDFTKPRPPSSPHEQHRLCTVAHSTEIGTTVPLRVHSTNHYSKLPSA